ncbi:hypothetical protein CQ393_07970 [Stenotrophomonas sp. MYb238]|nr:hypothetical protein [Stenotrophomonas sp. MYb238]
MQSPSPTGARRHGLRATGARALERPRRWRGPGRGAGGGKRVGRSLRHAWTHAASSLPSSAPSGHLLPEGEGKSSLLSRSAGRKTRQTVSVTLFRCGGRSGLWPRRSASALIAR